MEHIVYFAVIPSPIGKLTLTGDETHLSSVLFEKAGGPTPPPEWVEDAGRLERPIRQLAEYFRGERTHFELTLGPRGTAFQRRVWTALTEIPFGSTWSYAELARRIGMQRAARAVGAANGKNPLPVIVPCHRVIGADGSLTGFGGGLERKRRLLELEARVARVRGGATAVAVSRVALPGTHRQRPASTGNAP